MLIVPAILANVITADLGFLPGLAIFGPAFGLPLSLLAAILERPFYSRAGIGRWAVWYSLQANLVSLLFGYLLVPVAIMALHSAVLLLVLLWLPLSVFLSIVIERHYLNTRKPPSGFDGGWVRVSIANVFSATVLIGVLMLSFPFNNPRNRLALAPYENALTYGGIAISLITFAVAFMVPAVGVRRAAAAAGKSVRTQM